MSSPRLRFVTLFLALMPGLTSAADDIAQPKMSNAPPEARPGWIIVDEEIWIRLNDEPSHHMREAHESFAQQELETASNELLKASAYLHIAARNGAIDAKKLLTASALELDRLADDVHAVDSTTIATLDSAFARAEHALAVNHHSKAHLALSNNKSRSAGHYLASAITNIENAAKWTGRELEGTALTTVEGLRFLSGKLVEGTGFVVDEAGKGVTWVGDEVIRLGKAIEQHRKTETAAKPVVK